MCDRTAGASGAAGASEPRANRVVRYLVTVAAVGTFFLMAAGFFSVSIGGYPSCHGFPMCNGRLLPFLHPNVVAASGYTTTQVTAEWSHRAIGFVTGVLMLVASVVVWRRPSVGWLARWSVLGATALMPLEAWLGVVTSRPAPPIMLVFTHLVVSFAIFVGVVLAALALWSPVLGRSDGGFLRSHL